MDINSLMERRPSPQDSPTIFMPTAISHQQALSSLTMASPERTAYIESWATSIRNAFSMSPASSIRTSSTIRTTSSRRTGAAAMEALPTLVEDSSEMSRDQSVNAPISDGFIGQLSANGEIVCLYPSCSGVTFGRQADFRRHYESIHNTKRVEYYCPIDGCQRSRNPSGRPKGRSFGNREEEMREHVRFVHEIGRIREREDTGVGTEAALGTQERPILLDVPQIEVQPTTSAPTSASTMSRALSTLPTTTMSQIPSIRTGPPATATEALSVPVETVTELLGNKSFNALHLHDPVRVPDQVIDQNFMALDLSHEDLYLRVHDLEAPSSHHRAHIRSTEGSSKVVGVISKTPYVRPSHPRIMCQYCTERPEGFQGTHELDRHIARAHAPRRKGYICVDYSPDKQFLASCKHCRSKKVYGAYYNAAAHLRRAHFRPRKRGRKGDSDEARGGDHPAMDYLKQNWIREVDVDNNIIQPVTPTSPRAAEADGSKVANISEPMSQQWGNQEIGFQHGNGPVPITAFEQDLFTFPLEGVQLENLHLGYTDDDAYQNVEGVQGIGHKRKRAEIDVGNESAYLVDRTDQSFETLFGLPEAEAWPTTHRLHEDSFTSPFAQIPAS